jgi:hypothetical protein
VLIYHNGDGSCISQEIREGGELNLEDMGLGDKAAAFAFVEKAIAANPIEKDAVAGTVPIEILAHVAAQMGEPDRAIATLQKLLSVGLRRTG